MQNSPDTHAQEVTVNPAENPWGDGSWGKKPQSNKPSKEGGQPPSQEEMEELLRKGKEQFRRFMNGGGKNTNNLGGRKIIVPLISLALALWFSTGIYTVNTREEAVVMRFGKFVRTDGPGLNYHMPYPIEEVEKVGVTERYRREIGYRVDAPVTTTGRWQQQNTVEQDKSGAILMLTGDENIVDISFEVQWQITDARKYLFNVRDPFETVRDAAESAMREVIGTTPINDTLSNGRTAVQAQVKQTLQAILDSYDAGIQIEGINMKAVPPPTVDESFKDVQAAKINKEEAINKAIAYRNEVLPRAQGQASRFTQIYQEYKMAKDVTRRRMYLETMEEVLKGMDKVILSSGAQGVVPYLPLNELRKHGVDAPHQKGQ